MKVLVENAIVSPAILGPQFAGEEAAVHHRIDDLILNLGHTNEVGSADALKLKCETGYRILGVEDRYYLEIKRSGRVFELNQETDGVYEIDDRLITIIRFHGYHDAEGRWVVVDSLPPDPVVVVSSQDGLTLTDIRNIDHCASPVGHWELNLTIVATAQSAESWASRYKAGTATDVKSGTGTESESSANSLTAS